MFFAQDDLNIQIIDIFKITRGNVNFDTQKRNFSVLSQRVVGEAKIVYREETFKVNKGDVLYIPSNIEYSQLSAGETIIAIHLNILNYEDKDINVISPQNRNECLDVFEQIYDEWSKKKFGYQYRASAILYHLLACFHAQSMNTVAHSKKFNAIKESVEYLDDYYMDSSLTIERAAARSNIGAVYFRRIFKSIFGISPLKYLTSVRITKAKKLLESGYYKIYQVAEMSGFSDVKYFSTVFKKEIGKPPSDYIILNLME